MEAKNALRIGLTGRNSGACAHEPSSGVFSPAPLRLVIGPERTRLEGKRPAGQTRGQGDGVNRNRRAVLPLPRCALSLDRDVPSAHRRSALVRVARAEELSHRGERLDVVAEDFESREHGDSDECTGDPPDPEPEGQADQ